ncbi:hypothetical protein QK061_005375 [Escherichia coli]|nr:hypothetical protein [Escherichia coli]ELX3552077.1 hypothetical protein [Escherichia coli]
MPEGDHQDGPGDDQLTLAAALRAQPIPRKTSTAVARRSGTARGPDKNQGLSAYAPGKAVLLYPLFVVVL